MPPVVSGVPAPTPDDSKTGFQKGVGTVALTAICSCLVDLRACATRDGCFGLLLPDRSRFWSYQTVEKPSENVRGAYRREHPKSTSPRTRQPSLGLSGTVCVVFLCLPGAPSKTPLPSRTSWTSWTSRTSWTRRGLGFGASRQHPLDGGGAGRPGDPEGVSRRPGEPPGAVVEVEKVQAL